MLNSLDLLVIAFMALAAASLLSLALMFLLKNRIARSVCFYVASAVGLYLTSVGLRIGIGGLFTGQIVVGILTAILGIGLLVLGIVGRVQMAQMLAVPVCVMVGIYLISYGIIRNKS